MVWGFAWIQAQRSWTVLVESSFASKSISSAPLLGVDGVGVREREREREREARERGERERDKRLRFLRQARAHTPGHIGGGVHGGSSRGLAGLCCLGGCAPTCALLIDRGSSQFEHYSSTEMCSGSEGGSYFRLIDFCITEL